MVVVMARAKKLEEGGYNFSEAALDGEVGGLGEVEVRVCLEL